MTRGRFSKAMVRAYQRVVNGRTVVVPAHRRTDHGTLPRARMRNNARMAVSPEQLAEKFGPEHERFTVRDKSDNPLLARRFGKGGRHAYALHDGDGAHIATLHVNAGKEGARVTAGWTHDGHSRRGVHVPLLRKLVSYHGTVTSATAMHHDLHSAFNDMGDDHELSTERTDGDRVRYRLQRKQATLFKGLRVRLRKAWFGDSEGHGEAANKGHEGRKQAGGGELMSTQKVRITRALLPLLKARVKGHWRQSPEGKMFWVPAYTDKRTKKTTRELGGLFSLPEQPAEKQQRSLFDGATGAATAPSTAPASSGPLLKLETPPAAAGKPLDPSQKGKRYRDVGEKIGGARKDIADARAAFEKELTAQALDDLEIQDADVAARVCVKAKIWPKPNLTEWTNNGFQADKIILARALYDSIGARPAIDTPQGRKAYHAGVQMLQELVEASADFSELKANLDALAGHTKKAVQWARPSANIDAIDEYTKAVGAMQAALGNTSAWLVGRKRVKGFSYFGWRYQIDYLRSHGESAMWNVVHSKWPETTTRKARPKGEKAEDLWKPDRPIEYERLGDVKPIDVRDAGTFIDLFGVRGVEFGNWMDDAASAVHVNRAAEALVDLADGLGIDPKQVSINGRLALAFGARGSGSALAHYEPGKVVINITKLGGAGTLAHEWAHFLDHMIAKVELGQPSGHASDMGNARPLESDTPIVAAMKGVMQAIHSIPHPTGRGRLKTAFLEQSKKRGSYWEKPEELFARAFECYINDAMAEKGRGNNYLSYEKNLRDPRAPYPRGDERAQLKVAFDKLLEAVRHAGTLKKALTMFQKAHVKAHTRKLKSGKVVQVGAYEDKRTRKANTPAMGNRQRPEMMTYDEWIDAKRPGDQNYQGDTQAPPKLERYVALVLDAMQRGLRIPKRVTDAQPVLRRAAFEASDEFQEQFAGSLAIDGRGKPLLLYSGRPNASDENSSYFATNPTVARVFASVITRAGRPANSPTVQAAYLVVRNPLVFEGNAAEMGRGRPAGVEKAELDMHAGKGDYDGIIIRHVYESGFATDVVVVRDKSQIIPFEQYSAEKKPSTYDPKARVPPNPKAPYPRIESGARLPA